MARRARTWQRIHEDRLRRAREIHEAARRTDEPNRLELKWATLRALRALDSSLTHYSKLDDWVATDLNLGEEILKPLTRNRRSQTKFENNCGWARTELHYIGAVVNSGSRPGMKSGHWALTERGDWIRLKRELSDLHTGAADIRKQRRKSGNTGQQLSADELEVLWSKWDQPNPRDDPDELVVQKVEQALGVYGGATPEERRAIELAAMEKVMNAERDLGHTPKDVSDEYGKGYDIKSLEKGTDRWRRIEVKGRAEGADTVTVTHNEIRTALKHPDAFILAIVEVAANGKAGKPRYVRRPFRRKPDKKAISVTYRLSKLLAHAKAPS